MNKKNTSPANKLKQYFMANNEWNAGEIMLRIEQLIDDEKSAIINAFETGYSCGDDNSYFNNPVYMQNLSSSYFKQNYEL